MFYMVNVYVESEKKIIAFYFENKKNAMRFAEINKQKFLEICFDDDLKEEIINKK